MLWLWIVLALLVSGLVGMLVFTWPLSGKVYNLLLTRDSPEKWGYVCSAPENEEQMAMWNEGVAWAEAHRNVMEEVDITSQGLRLHGELYHLGNKGCVIILPGRCECLRYSCYFAKPYGELGYSVLVVDQRAHGKSQGTYSSAGYLESRDLRAWADFLRKEKGFDRPVLHGICVGSAGAILAMTKPGDPLPAKAFITEGCFISFRESFKQHMLDQKRPLFPVLDMIMLRLWKNTGTLSWREAPLRHVPAMEAPALFLFGRQDKFSLPRQSQRLFDACGSRHKKLVWFDKGAHSHLRINNREAYDRAIREFLTELEAG